MSNVNSNESIVLEVGENVDIDVQRVEGGYTIVTVSATGGGGAVAVQEESVEVVAEASALNFDGDDFDITDAGSGVAAIDVAATHAGSTHSAATDAHIADTTDVHDHGSLSGLADDDHTQYLKETDVAAKGDIYAASADNTVGVLSVGTDNQILIADSAQALGVKWGDNVGGSGAPTDADYLVGTANGSLSAEIVVGTSPGGELGGTWASPTVDATHAGSTHSAATDTHIADAADAHDASAISVDSTTLVGTGTDVQAVFEEVDNDIAALKAVDYLVGTTTGTLSAEIVVGTSPGGELGGTWASPTVDATHSGSAHHTQSHDHSAAGDGTTLTPATLTLPSATTPAQTTLGQVVFDSDDSIITVGDGASRAQFLPVIDIATDPTAVSTASSDGNDDNVARKDHVHAHEAAHINHDTTWAAKGDLIAGTANDTAAVVSVGANDTILMADSAQAAGVRWQAPATTSEIADIADSEGAGTSDTWARGDHVHSGSAYRATADIVHSITFTKTGTLTTGTGATRWYNDTGGNITLQSARGSVGTAPTGQSILVDVNNNGTSVWNATQANRITIAAAGNTDEGGAFDDSTIADGEYITVDIDQIGSGDAGADLTVTIWWTAA